MGTKSNKATNLQDKKALAMAFSDWRSKMGLEVVKSTFSRHIFRGCGSWDWLCLSAIADLDMNAKLRNGEPIFAHPGASILALFATPLQHSMRSYPSMFSNEQSGSNVQKVTGYAILLQDKSRSAISPSSQQAIDAVVASGESFALIEADPRCIANTIGKEKFLALVEKSYHTCALKGKRKGLLTNVGITKMIVAIDEALNDGPVDVPIPCWDEAEVLSGLESYYGSTWTPAVSLFISIPGGLAAFEQYKQTSAMVYQTVEGIKDVTGKGRGRFWSAIPSLYAKVLAPGDIGERYRRILDAELPSYSNEEVTVRFNSWRESLLKGEKNLPLMDTLQQKHLIDLYDLSTMVMLAWGTGKMLNKLKKA